MEILWSRERRVGLGRRRGRQRGGGRWDIEGRGIYLKAVREGYRGT
jgi:hypothetical protein